MHEEFLATTALFADTTADEVKAMLGCLGMRTRSYAAGEYIHHMGDCVSSVGVVVEGSVRVESVDAWGNVSVIGTREPGQLFGEVHAAVPDEPLMANAVAATDCTIVFLKAAKVLSTCSHACPHHSRASNNLTRIIARQNLSLARRILHSAPKTIRGKVIAYLSFEAERAGSPEFDIPYGRQQLADYLGVDRSALSAELSRMVRDGILETRRSHFVLKDIPD